MVIFCIKLNPRFLFSIGFGDFFEPLTDYTFLTYNQLNDYLYPGIGLIYLTSVLLTGLFTCCIGRCFEEEYIYPV